MCTEPAISTLLHYLTNVWLLRKLILDTWYTSVVEISVKMYKYLDTP